MYFLPSAHLLDLALGSEVDKKKENHFRNPPQYQGSKKKMMLFNVQVLKQWALNDD